MGAIYQNGVWYCPTGVHSGFTPVGTVISVMGVTAPINYLACNGQVVNISDYPELALYFETQFGDKNHFGGDGVTTFGIPDLRGEFLRGTGTNSHTNQGSGETVGVHQDGTEHLRSTLVSATGEYFVYSTNEQYVGQLKQDSFIGVTTKQDRIVGTMQSVTQSNRYTSRPTNTSVLYCIATKNIFMDAGQNYSTEEQVVGTWIDGKPIYQKTIAKSIDGNGTGNSDSPISITVNLSDEIQNLSSVIEEKVMAKPSNSDNFHISPIYNGPLTQLKFDYDRKASKDDIQYILTNTWSTPVETYLTVRYTKTTD